MNEANNFESRGDAPNPNDFRDSNEPFHHLSPEQEFTFIEELVMQGYTTLEDYLLNPTYWSGMPKD